MVTVTDDWLISCIKKRKLKADKSGYEHLLRVAQPEIMQKLISKLTRFPYAAWHYNLHFWWSIKTKVVKTIINFKGIQILNLQCSKNKNMRSVYSFFLKKKVLQQHPMKKRWRHWLIPWVIGSAVKIAESEKTLLVTLSLTNEITTEEFVVIL